MQFMKNESHFYDEVVLEDNPSIETNHGPDVHFIQQQNREILSTPLFALNTNTTMQYCGQSTFFQPFMPQTLHFPQQVFQQTKRIPQAAALPAGEESDTFLQFTGTVSSTGIASSVRRPCNCSKSKCLKLYCDCFAAGQLCQNCKCVNCMNNINFEDERTNTIKKILDRNPMGFHPKIGRDEDNRHHTKGCNCKRSKCLKNYCECFEAKISCSDLCRCHGCCNSEEKTEQHSLMIKNEIKNLHHFSGEKILISNFLDSNNSPRNSNAAMQETKEAVFSKLVHRNSGDKNVESNLSHASSVFTDNSCASNSYQGGVESQVYYQQQLLHQQSQYYLCQSQPYPFYYQQYLLHQQSHGGQNHPFQ